VNAVFFGRLFAPFALGYFLSYALRTINAIIAPQLSAELSLTPSGLGFLTAGYFLAFAAMQVPLGIWLDKHRPRKVEGVLLLVAACGALVFASARSLEMLIIGRALIGAGVCCCLMASFRSFGLWLPKDRLPLVNGIQLAIGSLGAISATLPAQTVMSWVGGWRGLFFVMAAALAVSAVWLYFFTPDPPRHGEAPPPTRAPLAPFNPWRDAALWTLMPFAALNIAHGMSFQALWASPWLTQVAGVSPQQLGGLLILVSIGMMVGNMVNGIIASHLGTRGILPHQYAFVLCVLGVLAQLPFLFNVTMALPLWLFLFGFFNSGGNVIFSGIHHFFAPQVLGRVLTAYNLAIFSLAFLLQWGTGLMVSAFPLGNNRYAPLGFQLAFGLVAGLQVMSLIAYRYRVHRLQRFAAESC
jgi:predicted MFS family arabinose efflux permease